MILKLTSTIRSLPNKTKIVLFFLISTYLAGLIGIGANIHPAFIQLTPFSLLFSFALIIFHWEGAKSTILGYALTIFCWGYMMEVVGVQTGFPFGTYSYGSVFGWKLLDTPLLIGVNWFLLSYGTGNLINFLIPNSSKVLRVVIGALMLVLLDLMIEPIAIRYEFWSWEVGHPPIENYIGWFFVGLIPMLLFFELFPNRRDIAGLTLIIMQYLFFGGLLLVK